jgi:hypothetical protein
MTGAFGCESSCTTENYASKGPCAELGNVRLALNEHLSNWLGNSENLSTSQLARKMTKACQLACDTPALSGLLHSTRETADNLLQSRCA